MRILFITHYFPPYDHIGSARTGKTAKYLVRSGHDVRVIAARDTLTPFTQLPVEIPAEKIIYTKWFSALYRADLALNSLAQKLRKGSLAGASVSAGEPSRPVNGWQYRSSLTRAGKALRDAARTILYFPDSQVGWLPYGLAAGRTVLRTWRPDVILASSGPHTALLIASILSREFKVPWVAEFRDLWVDNHQYQHPAWRKKIESALERRVVATATGLVTVSHSLAERLRERYSAEVEVVYNGFDPGDHGPAPTSSDRELTIVYTGWVYEQHDLGLFLEALQKLGDRASRVRVKFYRADSASIARQAAARGLGDSVEVHEGVSFMESLRIQRAADVLLYFSWSDPRETGIFSGKLFQYFGARRPILAIGPTENEPARMITDRGLGFASADSSAIAERINGWIHEKERVGTIPDIAPEASEPFSRQAQTRKLERFLAKVVGG